MKEFGPEDALKLEKPTKSFLCPLEDSQGIEFEQFAIFNQESKTIFDTNDAPLEGQLEVDFRPEFEQHEGDKFRGVKYTLGEQVLRNELIQTKLIFSNNRNEPLQNFRMVEKHFLDEVELASYDFTYPFVLPNSTNCWESLYETPKLSVNQIERIVANPLCVSSDTFYFEGSKLVIHQKVRYTYVRNDKKE